MYRFLLRPRWVVLHVLVLVAVVVMVNLGLWQLRRLDERRDRNALIEARADSPPVSVTAVLSALDDRTEAEASEWTSVEATGTYDTDAEVLVRNRSYQGIPGYHVLTPLRLSSGTALVVNRGWVPLAAEVQRRPDVPPPPPGEVHVVGRLRPSQERGRFGPQDPGEGHLDVLSRADLGRLGQQVPYDLLPAYVELVAQQPAPADGPLLIPEPDLDEGPHLSYAVQWFLFSAFAVAGWVILVRREVTKEGKPRPPAGGPGTPGAPGAPGSSDAPAVRTQTGS